MPKTIAVCNQKGGVGKTTTAINLGSALSLSGIKVLIIDLDPQANATSGLGLDKQKIDSSIYQVLIDGLSIEAAIQETQVGTLRLVPSQVALSGAEVELVSLLNREGRLRRAVDPIRSSYDLILIDAPPSLGLLTINALNAADSVLIPLQCEYYAMEGLSQLLETIRMVQENLNGGLSVEGVLLTMADFRTKLTNDVIQEVRRFFGPKVYDVVIPRSIRLSEAPSHGVPIALYDPNSAGAQAYQKLAEKIKEVIHGGDARVGKRDASINPGGEPPSGADRPSEGAPPIEGSSRIARELGPSTAPSDPSQSIPTSKES